MEEILEQIISKVGDVKGFSQTDPNMPLREILKTFADKMIIHDYRGLLPEWPENHGWIIAYYPSNRYLWVIYAFIGEGKVEEVEIKKYEFDIIKVRESHSDLKLRLLKWAVWNAYTSRIHQRRMEIIHQRQN